VPGEWLLSGQGDDGAARLSAGEAGASVLSTFLVLPPGSERETVYRYRLPASVLTKDEQGWHYRLMLQKQPGVDTLPLTINVALPPSAELASASTTPTMRADRTLTFSFKLSGDQQFELNFHDRPGN